LSLERRRRTTLRVILISPLIVATFVLTGVGLGFYVADLSGLPPAITAVTFSTAGLFFSLPIIVKMIDRMIADEGDGVS